MLTKENAVDIPPQLEQITGIHSAEVLSEDEFIDDISPEPVPEWANISSELYIIRVNLSGVPPKKALFEINLVLSNADGMLQVYKADESNTGQTAYILHTKNRFKGLRIVS